MESNATSGACETVQKKSFTRFIPHIARVLLGLPFLIGGLNGIFKIFPEPSPTLPKDATAFLEALVKSGYMMQLILGTHLIVGILLVLNRFVPLALALIAPFLVNAVAFHFFLEPSGLPIASIFLALEIYLAWAYRNAFRPMLAMRTTPGVK